MDDFSYLLRNSLEYYDSLMLKNYDLVRKFKYYKINKEETRIYFYDKKKDLILSYKYELIGKYLCNTHIWVWGWSVGEATNKLIDTSKKVLNYAFDLDKRFISLKNELITSRHQISSEIQLDIFSALSAYLSKKSFVYKLNDVGEIETDDGLFKISKSTDAINVYYLVLIQD